MIAPHREASEDDSKVTELRISQILTEINGWKIQVTVIGDRRNDRLDIIVGARNNLQHT
jgi:hypothetical protein